MKVANDKQIEFNPTDWKSMRNLMQRADEFTSPLVGENKDGERVLISINSDNITTETFQKNNWLRTNIYWDDFTVEELYKKCV